MTARQIDIATEEITCDNGMPAFLAHPAGGGNFPTVILMHERYGFVQHTKDQAMRCARDGFAVVAPNFFFKHPDQRVLNAGDSRYDITDPESVELIKAAIAALRQHKAADLSKIVVAGYCQTGRHPLVFAAEVPISAAVVWYGAASKREWAVNKLQPKPLDDVIAALSCPVFAAFGEADHIISRDDVRRFRDCLEAHRKSYDIHIYRDAPHGWLNDTMPGRYRKAQADAGWAAQQRFLTDVFAGGHDGSTVRWRFESESGLGYDFPRTCAGEQHAGMVPSECVRALFWHFGAEHTGSACRRFYRKTVSNVVSSSTVAGYDVMARAIARHIGKHRREIQRRAQHDGRRWNHGHEPPHNAAEKDGTVIGLCRTARRSSRRSAPRRRATRRKIQLAWHAESDTRWPCCARTVPVNQSELKSRRPTSERRA